MKEKQKKYIKYLGEIKPLDECVESEGLEDAEVLQAVIKFYEKSSKEVTKARTKFYQEKLKVTPRQIKIEKIDKRWGSCNTKREITYHYLITTLPMELIDYIVVHELCHIYHMNHERSFWRKVGSIIPDYKKRAEMLDTIGS